MLRSLRPGKRRVSIGSHALGGDGNETYQVIELDRGDALVDARDDLLRNCCGVDVIGIETIA